MTNRTNPVRHSSRFPVSWPVLYGNDAFLAEGTVLDLTARGWRIAGSMPVAPGMQLTLKVSVPDKPTLLCVHQATVLWVREHEFAIEAHEMGPIDQAWVIEFLRQKLGLMWMSRTTDQETPLQDGDEAPRGKTALPQPSIPTIENILHMLGAVDTASTSISFEARWNNDSDFQEINAHTLCDRLSEKFLREAQRILHDMVAIKATRKRTGWDPIVDN